MAVFLHLIQPVGPLEHLSGYRGGTETGRQVALLELVEFKQGAAERKSQSVSQCPGACHGW